MNVSIHVAHKMTKMTARKPVCGGTSAHGG